TGKASQFFGLM
nr:Chain A, Tachykinin-4 [Homo sapiens]